MPIEPLPTLIIGLGDTGGQVARALKLAVRAANGGQDQPNPQSRGHIT